MIVTLSQPDLRASQKLAGGIEYPQVGITLVKPKGMALDRSTSRLPNSVDSHGIAKVTGDVLRDVPSQWSPELTNGTAAVGNQHTITTL